jgi:glycolate oxidase FAD binding subunit
MQTPTSVAELQELVRAPGTIRVGGGLTKSAWSREANVSMTRLSGVTEYDPSEFTFTAQAGTALREVVDLLSRSGQFLPFDPLWVDAGSTLGGTVASGLSGSGRFRYGGVRDFILGVQFVTGDGELRSGGGKVVKNAAGFDFPKLLVGSRGTMGIMTSITFKVFPRPQRFATLRVEVKNSGEAVELMQKLAGSPLELTCLDFEPPGVLWLRFGGLETALSRRIDRTCAAVGRPGEILLAEDDARVWSDAREFRWLGPDRTLFKIPTQTRDLPVMEEFLLPYRKDGADRRYGVGGNVCWLAWPDRLGPAELVPLLAKIDRRAMAVRGQSLGLLGPSRDAEFARRLAQVFDPAGKLART